VTSVGVPGAGRQRFRRSVVDVRPCGNCGLRLHDSDAKCCKSCGEELPPPKQLPPGAGKGAKRAQRPQRTAIGVFGR